MDILLKQLSNKNVIEKITISVQRVNRIDC